MNVTVAEHTAQGATKMKAFTIDTDNNITVHASRKAAKEAGAGVFASEVEFADLIGPDISGWSRSLTACPASKP